MLLPRFIKNESGATATEYGLIATLIAVVIVTAVMTLASPGPKPSNTQQAPAASSPAAGSVYGDDGSR